MQGLYIREICVIRVRYNILLELLIAVEAGDLRYGKTAIL